MPRRSARLPCVRIGTLCQPRVPSKSLFKCCTVSAVGRSSSAQIINKVRAALLEEGITIAQGIEKLPRILEDAENGLCPRMCALIADLHERIQTLDDCIKNYDQQVIEITEDDEDCQRLQTISCIGPLTTTPIKMAMGQAENFTSGKHFAPWLGLVPRQVSTGGKPKLLGMSKRGAHR